MSILAGLENVQNLHPLFVHFPIALILITLLFEALWWITKRDQFRDFASYLLYLSALSAIAAVTTGYLASDSLGHDAPGHEFVHEHREAMLWMSGLLLVTTLAVLFIRSLRVGNARRLLIVPLLIVSGLLIYGADKGGRLVFEYGMGVKAISVSTPQESDAHEHDESEETIPDQQKVLPDTSSQSEKSEDGHSHTH